LAIETNILMQLTYFEEVNVGDHLPSLIKEPSHIQLFRYSAITWNTHRIHYDQRYAAEEGYPDVLVQSHLHGAFLTQLCTDWMGPEGELKSIELSVRRFAVPGDTLNCRGVIEKKEEKNGEGLVHIKLEEVNQKGDICVPGKAVIKLPRKNS